MELLWDLRGQILNTVLGSLEGVIWYVGIGIALLWYLNHKKKPTPLGPL